MSKKRLRQLPSKNNALQTAPPMFDDALPERLQVQGNQAAQHHVPVYRGSAPHISPYVIRLTRGDELPTMLPSQVAASASAALATHMVLDTEDDAVPLALTQSEFTTTAQEIGGQLREIEMLFDLPTSDDIDSPEGDIAAEFTFEDLVARSISADEFLPTKEVSLPAVAVPLVAVVTEKAVAIPMSIAEVPTVALAELVTVEEDATAPAVQTPAFSWRRFLTLPHGWQRALAAFTGLSFLLVLPLHAMQTIGSIHGSTAQIEAQSKAALEDFTLGASAFADQRFTLAEDEFSRAASKFAEAEAKVDDMHAVIVAVVNVIPETDKTYDSVRGLITAGRELSVVARMVSEAADTVGGKESTDIVTKLNLLATALSAAVPHADLAAAGIKEVDPSVVPEQYAEQVAQLQEYVPRLSSALHEFLTFSSALSSMLGGDGSMRYLVAFQNNTELRPTGGFIGSFAELNVEHGVIEDMRIPGGGTYDVQGQLTQFVAAPGPLSLLKARWEMQDANWFPDFPTSAKKLQWFYEHAGGPTTDGVIAVNANFVVKLLALTGPVEMPEYGRTIDAENFIFETQKIVELEYDKAENAPKAFIGDLAPILLERITEADLPTFLAMLDVVGEGLQQKDIQVFFTDNDLESAIEDLGWSGSIKQTSGDYLMVVNTNLGGGKTDAVIDQKVDVAVNIAEDGSVVNTVTITKDHHGFPDALFSGRNNVDYLRIYVPLGSQLLSADGFSIPSDDLFETSDVPLTIDDDLSLAMSDVHRDLDTGTDIWNEEGKTVFGNWMQVGPGQSETIHFRYRLPFSVVPETQSGIIGMAKSGLGIDRLAAYTMFVQKQPGVTTRSTTLVVSAPETMGAVWTSDADLIGPIGVTNDNAEDTFYRLLFETE